MNIELVKDDKDNPIKMIGNFCDITELSMLQCLIGEDIDLIWFPATTVLPVRIDPSQIDHILANLCVNVGMPSWTSANY